MYLLCKTNGIHFIPLLVPEVESAFVKTDEEFLAQYGFPKPAKDATNVVIGCRSGRRAATAIGMLEKLGYNSLMYVFVINLFIKIFIRELLSCTEFTKEVSWIGWPMVVQLPKDSYNNFKLYFVVQSFIFTTQI